MDVNARSVIHAAGAVVPHMLKAGHGRIVNVGANAALHGVARMGAYCAAKGAVIRLTEAMSAELREHGINVNCVLPTNHRHAGKPFGHAEGRPETLGRTR